MAASSRIIAVGLAVCLLVLLPVGGDSAKQRKPRFKIVERTYVSEPFISLPGVNTASRYPDSVEVHGRADAKLIDVDLLFFELSHDTPKDLDILLVAPDGRSALVMGDAGGASAVNGIDLTLDDDAKRALPSAGAISARSYRPANHDDSVVLAASVPGEDGVPGEPGEPGEDAGPGAPGEPGTPGGNNGEDSDEFPAPAPAPGEAVALSTFRGIDPTGEWQLFIRADGPGAGTLTGGWGLRITTKRPR